MYCTLEYRALGMRDWTYQYAKLPQLHYQMSKDTNNKSNKYLGLSNLGINLKKKRRNYPFLVDLGLQLEPSKLYFCGHKIRFAPSKVTCRLLPQRSDKSLFRFAKEDVLKENEPTKGNCGYKLPCYKASWSSDWLFSVTSIHLSLKQCYLRLLNDNT